ncbi:MAG: outer membrane protein transport protein [Akkermansiaceae bacterium]|nr:outer membrane protein transport protein [Verrucomicrobiales bacterium]
MNNNHPLGRNQIKTVSQLLVYATAVILLPYAVVGIGLRIPNQDAEAIARGNAFAATADNPSAIYYNPAGITQLPGQNVQIGDLNYLGINTHFDAPNGNDADTKFEVIPVPQIYYTASLKKAPLSFGFGIYAPFGLGVKWPQDSGFRSLAIDSKLQYITINPVIAWKVHPTLSIAMGPTINYSELMLRRGLTSASDEFKFKGHDLDLGFNTGILWQPHRQWSFGLNYRSATTMNYDGQSKYKSGGASPTVDSTAEVHFPQIASGGISFRPTPKWNIEVNVDWSDWETVDTIVLKGTSAIFGSDLPLQLNWHQSWFYEFGVTRYFDHGWFVAAGYFFCGDTTSERYFTPAVPDTDLHVGSVGFGRKGEHWRWALAGQIIAGPPREIENSAPNPFTGESADGKYQLFIPTISFSVGYQF